MAQNIEIIIKGDSTELTKSIKQVSGALDKLGGQAENSGKQISSSFGDMGKSVNMAFASFSGNLLANAVSATFSKISQTVQQGITDFIEFDKAIAEINSILNKNNQITEATRKTFLKFSGEFGKDAQTQAKAFYQIVSAGIEGTSKQIDVLRQANEAAVAGITDVDTATLALVNTMNAYASQGVTAQEVSDVLFKTVQIGQTTFEELAPAIGRVAPIANTAGVSLADLGGALGAITLQGVNTNEAVSGLRSLLSNILKPSEQAIKQLRQLNATQKDLNLSFGIDGIRAAGGLLEFIQKLSKATNGNKDAMSRLIGDVNGVNAAFILTGENIGKTTEIFNQTRNSMNATSEAAAKVRESVSFKLDQATQEIKNLGIAIGEVLAPAFASLLTGTVSATKALTNFFKGIGNDDSKTVAENIRSIENRLKFLSGEAKLGYKDVSKEVGALTDKLSDLKKLQDSFGVKQGSLVLVPKDQVNNMQDLLNGTQLFTGLVNNTLETEKEITQEMKQQADLNKELTEQEKAKADLARNYANALAKAKDTPLNRFLSGGGSDKITNAENFRSLTGLGGKVAGDIVGSVTTPNFFGETDIAKQIAEAQTKQQEEQRKKDQALASGDFDAAAVAQTNLDLASQTEKNLETQQKNIEKTKPFLQGAGLLSNVLKGKEGAKSILTGLGKTAINAFMPGLGEALGPALEALMGGPDAVRGLVRSFAQAVPDLIVALVDAIPVLIEELGNQLGPLIAKLAEVLPPAIVRATPAIINALIGIFTDPKFYTALGLALVKASVYFTEAIIKSMLRFDKMLLETVVKIGSELLKGASKFVVEIVKGAGRFVEEILKSIGGGLLGGSGGGGLLGNIPIVGGALGSIGGAVGGLFSDGGEYTKLASGGMVREVPFGINDTFGPAMLERGELVVDRSTTNKLKDYLGNNSSSGSNKVELIIGMKDNFIEVIEQKLFENQRLGISIV